MLFEQVAWDGGDPAGRRGAGTGCSLPRHMPYSRQYLERRTRLACSWKENSPKGNNQDYIVTSKFTGGPQVPRLSAVWPRQLARDLVRSLDICGVAPHIPVTIISALPAVTSLRRAPGPPKCACFPWCAQTEVQNFQT